MAENANKMCKIELEDISIQSVEKYTKSTIEALDFSSTVNDVKLDKLQDREKLSEVKIEKYKVDEKDCSIFSKAEITNLKKKATEDDKKKNEEIKDSMLDTYEQLLKKSDDILCKYFADGNVSGEDTADAISTVLGNAMNTAKSLIDSLYFTETAMDKLTKAININNDAKSGCILDKELIVKTFEASEKVLSEKLTQIGLDTDIRFAQLRNLNLDSLIKTAEEKLARFKSSDQMLEIQFKAEYAKSLVEISKAILAEFEASDTLLDLKLNHQNYATLSEKANAEVATFQASENVLSIQLSEMNAKERLATFEASPEVIKLREGILNGQLTEIVEKTKQIKAQILLVLKQSDGFSLDAKIKMFNVLMDGWKTAFASGGLEEIPAVISQNNISEMYHELLNKSDGFNGGSFKDELKITSSVETEEEVTIDVSWDSGKNGHTILEAQSNVGNIENYPKTVNDSGTETITVKKSGDGFGGLITVNIKTIYTEDAKNEDGTVCCDLTCPVEKIRSSQITYRMKDESGDCISNQFGDTKWNEEFKTCVLVNDDGEFIYPPYEDGEPVLVHEDGRVWVWSHGAYE